jgi:hypothetical protein
VEDFIEQQMQIMLEIDRFSCDYGLQNLQSNIRTANDAQQTETKRAVRAKGDLCFKFKDWLAIVGRDQTTPYAFCKHVSTPNKTPSKVIDLDEKSHYAFNECDVNERYFAIKKKGETIFYENKVNVYTLDVGIMYLFLENEVMQSLFIKNCLELSTFSEKDVLHITYDTQNNYLGFVHEGERKKIVGFQKRAIDFMIWRKMTFTSQRYHVYLNTKFNLPIQDSDQHYVFIQPWTAIGFLHVQFCHALSMKFYMERLMEDENNGIVKKQDADWLLYKKVCDELLHALQLEAKKKYESWKPSTIFDLIDEFKLKSGNSLLTEHFLHNCWKDRLKRNAWIANLLCIMKAYSLIINSEVFIQEISENNATAVINGTFVGTFTIDPVCMQCELYREECKFNHCLLHSVFCEVEAAEEETSTHGSDAAAIGMLQSKFSNYECTEALFGSETDDTKHDEKNDIIVNPNFQEFADLF